MWEEKQIDELNTCAQNGSTGRLEIDVSGVDVRKESSKWVECKNGQHEHAESNA